MVDLERREAARLLGARMLARALAFRGGAAIEPSQAAALLGWRRQVTVKEPGRRMAISRMQLSRVDRALVSAGLQPDGRQRWAVERVLDVRGVGSARQALIRWKAGSLVHPDSWEPWGGLTHDLRLAWWLRRQAAKRAGGHDAIRRVAAKS